MGNQKAMRAVGLAVALAVVLGLVAWRLFSPGESERGARAYPVRWTELVRLKSLDEIDRRLGEPVDMSQAGEGPNALELTSPDGKTRRMVKTPREWQELLAKGYYAQSTYDITMESWFISAAEPLLLLKRAAPARTSHLADFRMTGDVLRFLPPTLAGSEDPEEGEKVEAAAKAGKSWKDLYPETKVKVLGDHRVELTTESTSYNLELVAWGDLNGDGVEDVIVSLSEHAEGGSGRHYGHVVLTRLAADARLSQIDCPIKPTPETGASR